MNVTVFISFPVMTTSLMKNLNGKMGLSRSEPNMDPSSAAENMNHEQRGRQK